MQGKPVIKKYSGDRQCGSCESVSTSISVQNVTHIMGEMDVFTDYFCDPCYDKFTEEQRNANPITPEVAEEVRGMLQKAGMKDKEIQRAIMNMLNK